MKLLLLPVLAAGALLGAYLPAPALAQKAKPAAKNTAAVTPPTASAPLGALFAAYWQEQARLFPLEATAQGATAEIERYMSWPGQALSYKTGALKLRELRARYEKQLGNKFDLRAFHDEVLAGGSMPLAVLEKRMDAWAARQR